MATKIAASIAVVILPQEFIELYNLQDKIKNGHIYMRIVRGIYGPSQSGKLANDLLKKRLAEEGYFEVQHTPGLFKHKWRPVWFTLVVDDFGIKYIGGEHRDHLLKPLNKYYEVETDYNGELHCGVTLKWDYIQKRVLMWYVDISMLNYVHKNLVKYKHENHKKQVCPHEPAPKKLVLAGVGRSLVGDGEETDIFFEM